MIPISSPTLTYVKRDDENLESRTFVENVRSLPRSIFMMHYLVLCVKSLAFQKIVPLDGNAFPMTNHPLTNLSSESNHLGGVDIICLNCG